MVRSGPVGEKEYQEGQAKENVVEANRYCAAVEQAAIVFYHMHNGQAGRLGASAETQALVRT